MTTQDVTNPPQAQEGQAPLEGQAGEQAQPEKPKSPGRPRQNATVEEMNQLKEQLSSMGQQFAEFKSNASRRETELGQRAARAEKAAEFGPDSDEFRAWERDDTLRQGRAQAEQETLAAKRDAAMWKIKAEYPKVPTTVYGSESDPVAMENIALRWLNTGGTSNNPVEPADEVNPQTPQTMTQGGMGAPGVSDQDWLNRYGDDVNGNIPATVENTARAKKLMDSGLSPQVRA